MRISVIPASIPYIDDPMPEWVDEWGVQLYVKAEVDGFIGYGEVLVAGSGVISAYLGIFNDLILPLIETLSPSEIYEKFEKMLFSAGLCSITLGPISGVEMAINHAIVKSKKMAISDLAGGTIRKDIPVYASFPRYKTVDDVVKAVKNALERGFKVIKLHQPPNMIEESLKRIRDEIGYNIMVAVDLNAPFSLSSAQKFLKDMERYEVYWYEEPIYPPNDYDSLKCLTKDYLIAAGENEYTLYGFRKLLETGVNYIQLDISKIGGIFKFLKVLDLAESYNIQVIPHLRPHRSAISLFHTLQIASAKKNTYMVEFPLANIPEEVFGVTFQVNEGKVKEPDDIMLKEDVIERKYKFDKKIRVLKFSDLESH